ncbi:unnamed protein product [Nesidiocoris tenuis]|uniref:Cadherin domain-containing protein n=1 Tax=Nesidiocoris tenuis TaxID=355587 RepID=A0A6H5G8B5_9HEMI|nr:unnamed protein product [Nesidiocoris tenuis]
MFLKEYRPVLPEHVPPRKVVEVLATDDDDRSKNNGPPFTFRMDPNADDIIRASFKVEHDQKGANGDGMAVVYSQRSFDREQQKEYAIPIVIKDSGNPAMSATSTLTVVIGDVNDNKMQPGSKDIFVYNYMGQSPDTEVGRVNVYDLDDWDLPDKKFYWESSEHPRFKLNEDTDMLKISTPLTTIGSRCPTAKDLMDAYGTYSTTARYRGTDQQPCWNSTAGKADGTTSRSHSMATNGSLLISKKVSMQAVKRSTPECGHSKSMLTTKKGRTTRSRISTTSALGDLGSTNLPTCTAMTVKTAKNRIWTKRLARDLRVTNKKLRKL